MKAWEIVGYTYEAGIHCTDCAEKRFTAATLKADTAEDSEGNEVHPIFVSDEGWEDETCSDCGEGIG
jgi:hypothetical protein